jgi:hypothetical protein
MELQQALLLREWEADANAGRLSAVIVPPWMEAHSLARLRTWLAELDVERATPDGRLELALPSDAPFIPVLAAAARAVTSLRIESGNGGAAEGGSLGDATFPRLETLVVRDHYETTFCAEIMVAARATLRHLLLGQMNMSAYFDSAAGFRAHLSGLANLETLELPARIWTLYHFCVSPQAEMIPHTGYLWRRSPAQHASWSSEARRASAPEELRGSPMEPEHRMDSQGAPLPPSLRRIRITLRDGNLLPPPEMLPRTVTHVEYTRSYYARVVEEEKLCAEQLAAADALFDALPQLRVVHDVTDSPHDLTAKLCSNCAQERLSAAMPWHQRAPFIHQQPARPSYGELPCCIRERLDALHANGIGPWERMKLDLSAPRRGTSCAAGPKDLPSGPCPVALAVVACAAPIAQLEVVLRGPENMDLLRDLLRAHPEVRALAVNILAKGPLVEADLCHRLGEWLRDLPDLRRVVVGDDHMNMVRHEVDLGGSIGPVPSYAFRQLLAVCHRANATRRKDDLDRRAWDVVAEGLLRRRREAAASSVAVPAVLGFHRRSPQLLRSSPLGFGAPTTGSGKVLRSAWTSTIASLPLHFHSIASRIGGFVGRARAAQLVFDVYAPGNA